MSLDASTPHRIISGTMTSGGCHSSEMGAIIDPKVEMAGREDGRLADCSRRCQHNWRADWHATSGQSGRFVTET